MFTVEEKMERWNFVCTIYSPYEHVAAVNAFCWCESPLSDFVERVRRFQTRYQHDFFFSGFESIFDYMKNEHFLLWSTICEDITVCIDLCSRFGDIENAMKLLNYQNEHNLRSEQPALRL